MHRGWSTTTIAGAPLAYKNFGSTPDTDTSLLQYIYIVYSCSSRSGKYCKPQSCEWSCWCDCSSSRNRTSSPGCGHSLDGALSEKTERGKIDCLRYAEGLKFHFCVCVCVFMCACILWAQSIVQYCYCQGHTKSTRGQSRTRITIESTARCGMSYAFHYSQNHHFRTHRHNI